RNTEPRLRPRIWSFCARERKEMESSRVQIRPRNPESASVAGSRVAEMSAFGEKSEFLQPGGEGNWRSRYEHFDLTNSSGAQACSHRCYARSITTDSITTSLFGRSWRLRGTEAILLATSCPSITSPKIVCLPVSHSVGATVIKNCEPLVLGPAFAMASLPG